MPARIRAAALRTAAPARAGRFALAELVRCRYHRLTTNATAGRMLFAPSAQARAITFGFAPALRSLAIQHAPQEPFLWMTGVFLQVLFIVRILSAEMRALHPETPAFNKVLLTVLV